MVLFSNLKIPKKPFFQAFFTLLLLYLSQQNHALNGITFFPQEPPYLLTIPIYWKIKLYRLQQNYALNVAWVFWKVVENILTKILKGAKAKAMHP